MLYALLLLFSVPEEGKENGNCYRKHCKNGWGWGRLRTGIGVSSVTAVVPLHNRSMNWKPSFSILWFMFAIQEELWADQQSGWLDQGSWHVFCARAQLEVPAQVVLHLFHDCLQLGRGLRWAGRKAKTSSVQALLGLFCCCPEKAQFVHGASCCWKLRKPKHGWSQKELHKPMAGGSWMAFEWCLRNNINTKISSNREYNRKNSHACPLVQVISQSLMLPTSIRFHFSTRQNLNSFPNRGRKKAATQNKLQCVWIGEWEAKRRQEVLPGQDRGTECSNLLTQHQWNRVTVSVWQKKHVQDFRRQLKNF